MKFLRLPLCFVLVFLMGCGGGTIVPYSSAAVEQTGIVQTLLDLMDKQDKTRISPDDYQSTSLKEIITLGTPAGYRIKLRFLNFGISLVEALRVSKDPGLRERLLETVQWARNPQVRAEALITLAGYGDPAHKKFLKSAVLDIKAVIRF